MKKTIVIAVVLVWASLLAISGCTGWVSREDYISAVAELNEARDRIASLEAQISDMEIRQKAQVVEIGIRYEEKVTGLNAQIEVLVAERDMAQAEIDDLKAQVQDLNDRVGELTYVIPVEDAWGRAEERHAAVVSDSPVIGDILAIAPWIGFPDRPAWFEFTHIYPITLVDEPSSYQGSRIVTNLEDEIFISVYESKYRVSMECNGGDVDYEMAVTTDENGDIVQEMFRAGDTRCLISWTMKDNRELFTADIDGESFEIQWSEEPENFASFCKEFISWLELINRAGGLISPSDKELIILGLGTLREPLNSHIQLSWSEITRRVVLNICCGVPQTCLL